MRDKILLIGLGNPTNEYKNTRHNIGFMAIDYIAKDFSFTDFHKKFAGEFTKGKIPNIDAEIFLLKPQTYMNLSGNAVLKIAQFFKIPPENMFVFHDDVDLPIGKIKCKLGGGHGGHNGLRDIDKKIGKNYNRIRLGIGRPEFGDTSSFVLGKFTTTEMKFHKNLLAKIAKNLVYLLENNASLFIIKIIDELKNKE